MFDDQGTADWLRPVATALQTWLFGKRLSDGLTRDCLLICAGRGVRGGGEHARVRHPGPVASYRSPRPSQEARERASVAKSADTNATGPADIEMN